MAHYVSLNLANMGVNTTLYQRFRSLKEAEAWNKTEEAQNLKQSNVRTLQFIADYSLKNIWKYPYYVYNSPHKLDNMGYDVVHYNSPPVDANMLLPRAFSRRGTIQTVAIHGGLFYESKNFVGRIMFRSLAKYIHGAIALNAFSRKIALKQGFNDGRVHVIPNGVDSELICRIQPTYLKGNPSIVYAGRLEAIKGIDTLLQAAAELKGRLEGLRLYIVGSGSLEKKVKSVSEKLSPTVTYVGRLPSVRDVISMLKGADLVVIPSLKENFSISLLEAMASGTPLIVSDAEGNMDVVNDQMAWIFKRGSVSSLAETISKAHLNPEASKSKAELGKSHTSNTYNWIAIARRYLELFDSLRVDRPT